MAHAVVAGIDKVARDLAPVLAVAEQLRAEPAIAFDGTRMRIFVGNAGSPPGTYQSAFEGGAWTPWRRLSTRSYAFGQPAVTNVHGDLNVVTRGYYGTLFEQAME